MKNYSTVLSIAGFDGSGGAGIQADTKTFSALGCYATNVLTSLPVQNTQGVQKIYDLPLQAISDQLQCILEDIPPYAVKIGMLHKPEIIETVVNCIHDFQLTNIVIDPVMVAKSGDRLLQAEAIEVMAKKLLPLATVLTPNIPEAEDLLKIRILSHAQMEDAVKELHALGPQTIVLKGGHLPGDTSVDCFYDGDDIHWFESERVNTPNCHGTGCTFAAAVAAGLAKGRDPEQAVSQAKQYLYNAIKSGSQYKIGKGHGPVHHFHSTWKEELCFAQ